MKRGKSGNIHSLPPEILFTIFEYLNPKELSICSLISKQWYNISSSNEIWKKIFKTYHINLPLKNDVGIKEEYLKRSKDYLKLFLTNQIKSRRIHHLFPSFDQIRKLELSIEGELFDNKKNSLVTHGQRISVNNSPNISPIINYQTKINRKQFPELKSIDSFSVKLLIPALIKKLVPSKEAMRIGLVMSVFDWRKAMKSILCQECLCNKSMMINIDSKNSVNLIEWHMCITNVLIGIWSIDKSVAYFSYFVSLLDIQNTLERYMFKSLETKSIINYDNVQSKFILNESETDLKCMLSIDNIEPHKSLVVNCWRSVDYFKDSPIRLIEKSDSRDHLKFMDTVEFRPAIGHLHMKYDNIMRIQLDIVTSQNDPLWSHMSCVSLVAYSINNVDYNYVQTEIGFGNSTISGTLIQNASGYLYLTELIIL